MSTSKGAKLLFWPELYSVCLDTTYLTQPYSEDYASNERNNALHCGMTHSLYNEKHLINPLGYIILLPRCIFINTNLYAGLIPKCYHHIYVKLVFSTRIFHREDFQALQLIVLAIFGVED